MKQLLYLFFVLIPALVIAQTNHPAIGAENAGMGGVSVTNTNLWSVENNQAGLAFQDALGAGVHYENRFSLKELSYQSAVAAVPTASGAVGLSVTSFGFELYRQSKWGLGYGRKIGDKFAFGVQLNYLRVNLGQAYEAMHAITGAIGGIVKWSDATSLGFHIYNPTQNRFNDENQEKIPAVMRLGLMHQFSEKVRLALETEKNISQAPMVKVGLHYDVSDRFYVQGGMTSSQMLASFGLGTKWKDFSISFASTYHTTLGVSPVVSLVYRKQAKQ